MTESTQNPPTPIAPPGRMVSHPPNSANDGHPNDSVDEEPYTFKCICDFSHDDGSSILCESCDTWQHIDCFYPNHRAEDLASSTHLCAECHPRPLNRPRAIERQSIIARDLDKREQSNLALERKARKPPSKSHKKKQKPTDLQLNGHGTASTHNHDLAPPARRPKSSTSHKTNHSVSSQASKRSPSFNTARPPMVHPPSPVTTPTPVLIPRDVDMMQQYSRDFAVNYGQPEPPISQINSFANLLIPQTMSDWLRDPERMRHETGEDFKDVFRPLSVDISQVRRPLNIETKEILISHGPTDNVVVCIKQLAAPEPIDKDVPLMELIGLVGFQKDYCQDRRNRWDELTCPLPFVYFHPMLPLYIDTRTEGSHARYVRRSCKPNAVLDTYLSDESEYHFWLVSDRFIAAHEQVTIPWDFRFPKEQAARFRRVLGLADDDADDANQPQLDEVEYAQLCQWLFTVLAEYGGCACASKAECAFERFFRPASNHCQALPYAVERRLSESNGSSAAAKEQPRASVGGKKKVRRPKPPAISPHSMGPAINGRAASEGRLDEGSGPDTGQTPADSSRDMTSAHPPTLDQPAILTVLTDRDKRKVAMVEDTFRRMEQQPPRKKKKQALEGSNGTSKSKGHNPKGNSVTAAPATNSDHASAGSPVIANSPRAAAAAKRCSPTRTSSLPLPSPVYRDSTTQTDRAALAVELSQPHPLFPRPQFRTASVSRWIFDTMQTLRMEKERNKRCRLSSPPQPSESLFTTAPMDIDSIMPPQSLQPVPPVHEAVIGMEDVVMSTNAPESPPTPPYDGACDSPVTTEESVPAHQFQPTAAEPQSEPAPESAPESNSTVAPEPVANAPDHLIDPLTGIAPESAFEPVLEYTVEPAPDPTPESAPEPEPEPPREPMPEPTVEPLAQPLPQLGMMVSTSVDDSEACKTEPRTTPIKTAKNSATPQEPLASVDNALLPTSLSLPPAVSAPPPPPPPSTLPSRPASLLPSISLPPPPSSSQPTSLPQPESVSLMPLPVAVTLLPPSQNGETLASPQASTIPTVPATIVAATISTPIVGGPPAISSIGAVKAGAAVNPSPAKKKMSLSDYKSRLSRAAAAAAAAGRPGPGPTVLRPSLSYNEGTKLLSSEDANGLANTPPPPSLSQQTNGC